MIALIECMVLAFLLKVFMTRPAVFPGLGAKVSCYIWICLELRLGAVALTLCSLAYHPTSPLKKAEDCFG